MGRRRGSTDLTGILLVDKPAGVTSHDVVATVRRATGEGRVGHAGTLDPLATGLLVVLVGRFTRLEPYLSGATKSYDARISFGTETDTDDADGAVLHVADVPAGTFDALAAQSHLAALLGPSLQTPPAYSAIKLDGRTAHRAARAGAPLSLPARPIEVFDAHLTGVDPVARTWDVSVRVSKGTYVRALARDLGRACGTAAHLSALRRTASGLLSLDAAHLLDDIAVAGAEGHITAFFRDPLEALGLPEFEAPRRDVVTGRRFDRSQLPDLPAGARVAVTVEGRLAAVYRVTDSALEPDAVLISDDAR